MPPKKQAKSRPTIEDNDLSIDQISKLKPGELTTAQRHAKSKRYLVPVGYSMEEWIEMALDRFTTEKDREYFRALLTDIITKNQAPLELLNEVPDDARRIGKTRFDQIYDALINIAFPPYSTSVLKLLLGTAENKEVRVWRVSLPERYKVGNTLIRAYSYQDAYALACDYACRIHLRLFHEIPKDLTIRVQYMSNTALAKFLRARHLIRNHKSQVYRSGLSREFTPTQVLGARTAALGHSHQDPQRKLAIYIDNKDMMKARLYQGMLRMVNVELESLIDHPERGRSHQEKLEDHRKAREAKKPQDGEDNAEG